MIKLDADQLIKDNMSSWFYKDDLAEVDLEWFLP